MDHGLIVGRTGAEHEVAPDQVAAAAELTGLRDRCAGSEALDVAELRRAAAALRERAMADDSGDTYVIHREGMTVRVMRQGVQRDALDLLNLRLAEKHAQR